MNQKPKILILLALVLLASTVLIGCDQIPEEYTEGVRLDSSYPEDAMPIYDDAVVYYCEDEDESVSIKYGVEDDLDDVADFYKDHFEDNAIELDDEVDKSSRYAAEGIYEDFSFEVKVTNPSGGYEEKAFKTIVKVDIEFIDDSLGSVTDLQDNVASIKDDLPGFWRQESFEDSSGKLSTYEYGTAYEFLTDGTLNLYFDFTLVGAGGWAEVDASTVQLTAIDGAQEAVTVTFEKRSDRDYLIWEDSTGTLVFFRDTSEEFTTDIGTDNTNTDNTSTDNTTPSAGMNDSQLASAISDTTWYYIQYVDQDGGVQNSSTGQLIYYSDGTLDDVFDDETLTGNWYVSEGRLYCDYSDGSSSDWQIGVEYRGAADYLAYYSSSDPGAFWLYSSFPRDSIVTYATDEEMTSAIAGKDFNALYYMYADGTVDAMSDNPITFNADGTLIDLYEGERLTGTWHFAEGYFENSYDNGDAFHYPAIVEYNSVSDSYYLYLGDLEEGYENCYWIYTTYQP